MFSRLLSVATLMCAMAVPRLAVDDLSHAVDDLEKQIRSLTEV